MILDAHGRPFGDGDERFRRDAEAYSKFVLAGMKRAQENRAEQDGTVTAYCIVAGHAFAMGVLIKDLGASDRRRLREYFIKKLDDMLREHGA